MYKENNCEERSKPESPEKIILDTEDADYKPVLKDIINTRCNYDGSKIEGILE